MVVMRSGTEAKRTRTSSRAGVAAEKCGPSKRARAHPRPELQPHERVDDLTLGIVDRKISVEHVDIESLRPYESNPRVMPEEEMQALERSIERFGLVDPFVVRRQDSTVIGGNQRLVAAQRVGLRQVPVVFLDISEDEARVLNLALNRIQGHWDEPLLAALLRELEDLPDVDVSFSGFGRDEIDQLIAGLEISVVDENDDEEFDVDAALRRAEEECRVQPGEVWILGRHRLLCGDAATEDVQRLLAGEAAHMVFTDPPYNVAYNPLGSPSGRPSRLGRRRTSARDGNGRSRPLGPMEGDDVPPEQYQEFLVRSFCNLAAALPSGGAVYICGATPAIIAYSHAFAAADLHFSSLIVWDKGSLTLSRKDYHPQFELIWYGWPQGKPHCFRGGRTQTDIWLVSRENGRSYLHPTQKPLELVRRAIVNSSRPGQTVLDTFAGSGTTLIACEKSERRCLAMDIDPRFCEVAIARWEAVTGERARRAD